MADNLDLFDTQLKPQNLESRLSPHQQSPAPAEETVTVLRGSACDLESLNCVQKKAKCSSDQENQKPDQSESVLLLEGVKEKRKNADDKFEDVTTKLNDEKFDASRASCSLLHSPLVDKYGTRFSISEGSGKAIMNPRLSVKEVQMILVVKDRDNCLAKSCSSLSENISERFLEKKKEQLSSVSKLESISDSKSVVANFTSKSHMTNHTVKSHMTNHTVKSHSNGLHKTVYRENQRPRSENVKCALKIQVIDDTAVIGSASGVSKHVEKNMIKKNQHQETFAKERQPKRMGKILNKCSATSGDEMRIFKQIADSQRVPEIKAVAEKEKKKWSYSRVEMEALRSVNVEEQKKKWVEVYCGFGPDVTKEYEGLVDFKVDFNPQKNIRAKFDPRLLLRKKDSAPSILSDEFCDETESRNCLGRASDSVVHEDLVEEDGDFDDISDDDISIQRPAFLVTGEPDFDSGPPQDGLEYLRRVRWEVEHIPKVKVAKVDKSKLTTEQTIYMPHILDIVRCPDHLLPLKLWEDSFLADFSDFRLAISSYEGSNNICIKLNSPTAVLDTIFLPEILKNLITEEHDTEISTLGGCKPTLSTIMAMDFVARVSMLKKRICLYEKRSCLSRDDCVWIFSLCATIDKPLDADMCASLRCLLRKCASLRSQKTEIDDETIMLNILATISGKYFGQSDY